MINELNATEGHMVTEAQRNVLRSQLKRVEKARAAYEREMTVLGQLAIMLDERTGDPRSGVKLDLERLEIREASTGRET